MLACSYCEVWEHTDAVGYASRCLHLALRPVHRLPGAVGARRWAAAAGPLLPAFVPPSVPVRAHLAPSRVLGGLAIAVALPPLFRLSGRVIRPVATEHPCVLGLIPSLRSVSEGAAFVVIGAQPRAPQVFTLIILGGLLPLGPAARPVIFLVHSLRCDGPRLALALAFVLADFPDRGVAAVARSASKVLCSSTGEKSVAFHVPVSLSGYGDPIEHAEC